MDRLVKLLAVFALFIGASMVRSDDDPDKEACKKMAQQYFKRTHKIYIDCHADVKQNTSSIEETFDKFGCTVKCILKADKMVSEPTGKAMRKLDENDMVSDDLLKATYKDRVTPKYEDKLLAKFMDCKKNFGDKLDKADENCLSYKKYGLCMQEAMSHVCYDF